MPSLSPLVSAPLLTMALALALPHMLAPPEILSEGKGAAKASGRHAELPGFICPGSTIGQEASVHAWSQPPS
jgi:hypothetical protein